MSHLSPPATDSWTPLGWALSDYWQHLQTPQPQTLVSIHVFMEDGERLPLAASTFFRPVEELPEAESLALDYCRGRVLDLGAGAGAHSLVLQDRGLDVLAIDICPPAVDIMQRRGVRQTRLTNHLDLAADEAFQSHFDTLLLLMNGIGLAGEISGLGGLFAAAGRLLREGGQILCDSTDLRAIDDRREQQRMRMRQELGLYRGETRQRLAYRGLVGEPFGWLYLDPETLGCHAGRCGWRSQILFESDDGSYLARLVQSD